MSHWDGSIAPGRILPHRPPQHSGQSKLKRQRQKVRAARAICHRAITRMNLDYLTQRRQEAKADWEQKQMKSQIEIKVMATVDLPDGWVQCDYEYTFVTGEKVAGRTFHDGTLMGLLRAAQRDAWDELYKAGRRRDELEIGPTSPRPSPSQCEPHWPPMGRRGRKS